MIAPRTFPLMAGTVTLDCEQHEAELLAPYCDFGPRYDHGVAASVLAVACIRLYGASAAGSTDPAPLLAAALERAKWLARFGR